MFWLLEFIKMEIDNRNMNIFNNTVIYYLLYYHGFQLLALMIVHCGCCKSICF